MKSMYLLRRSLTFIDGKRPGERTTSVHADLEGVLEMLRAHCSDEQLEAVQALKPGHLVVLDVSVYGPRREVRHKYWVIRLFNEPQMIRHEVYSQD